jgi:cytochrome c-type biogenesis protein CcmH
MTMFSAVRWAKASIVTVLLVLVFGAFPACAVEPDEILPDARLETRARTLSGELRCLVCQNQSIDDSNAPLARDLRLLVRERLKTGDDDRAVLAYIVARYGEFVLLKPPLNASTVLLWLSPLLFLAGGLWFVARSLRMKSQAPKGTAPLTDSERAKLEDLLR